MQTSAPLKLSQLNQLIQYAIDGVFREQTYAVIAETSGIKNYGDKRQCYLTLVEKSEHSNEVLASIQAKIWGNCYHTIRNFEETTGQPFKDNIEILFKVRIQYHIYYGLNVLIEEIDCNYTIGKLALTRQAVLQKLIDQNPDAVQLVNGEFLTRNRQLNFPPVIQKIALISSAQADGYNDFVHELYLNKFQYTFQVDEYFAQVQGNEAANQICQKLIQIYQSQIAYDAVVIVRGGGSQLDFSAFDSYTVARAVARFPIPIITGIGHERNESICDLMARLPTKTPTKAAATIVAHNRSFEETILQLQKVVVSKTNEVLSAQKLILQTLHSKVIRKTHECLNQQQQRLRPLSGMVVQLIHRLVNNQRFKLAKITYQLNGSTEALIKAEQHKLVTIKNTVKLLSPENVLKRGYAIIFRGDTIIKNAAEVRPGDEITTIFQDSEIISTITETRSTYE
ncbi:exodeoxyribonuclease VII large subunit [Adhaeribacter radiodurans]|uniref:Exodeoxyribonuclease 7 large subunit n=1 Tax=Adhaeribacter radiodurans TaxID=2745197 RepID=A0A7L7L7E3_9BACT|nr:exodeoxyribonuclease VII large subunit [Adhaeribacter radiodurans]QMU28455.1 exodeoxyribonuclease VII large subunit [Adhaeribacter radiodurans]